MRDLADLLRRPGRFTLSGVPEGRDALALADLRAASDVDILYVARDDARLTAMAEALAVFAPEATPLIFPAWDCLPYDRVSPHPDICAQEVDALHADAFGLVLRGRTIRAATHHCRLEQIIVRDECIDRRRRRFLRTREQHAAGTKREYQRCFFHREVNVLREPRRLNRSRLPGG